MSVELIIYSVMINLITFILFYSDKKRAKKKLYRIQEKTLLMMCLIGGSVGGLLAMFYYHHKTRKPLFYLGVPLIFCIHIIVLVYINTL